MYRSVGPPKKYSTPRVASGESRSTPFCQKCASTAHWTFECKDVSAAERKTSVRLSRSQMLRWGIKQRRQEFVPEPTEREMYTAQAKEVERLLLQEAREEVLQKRRLEGLRCVKDKSNMSETNSDVDEGDSPVADEKKEGKEYKR